MPTIYTARDFGGPNQGQQNAADTINGVLAGMIAAESINAQRERLRLGREEVERRNRTQLRQLELQAEREDRVREDRDRQFGLAERSLEHRISQDAAAREQRQRERDATNRLLVGQLFGVTASDPGPGARPLPSGLPSAALEAANDGLAEVQGPTVPPGLAVGPQPDVPAGPVAPATDGGASDLPPGITLDDLLSGDPRVTAAVVAEVQDARATEAQNAARAALTVQLNDRLARFSAPVEAGGLGLNRAVGETIFAQIQNGDLEAAERELQTVAREAADAQFREAERVEALDGAKAQLAQMGADSAQRRAVASAVGQAELLGWDAERIRREVWEASAPDGARDPRPISLTIAGARTDIPVVFQPPEAGSVLLWGTDSAANRFFRMSAEPLARRLASQDEDRWSSEPASGVDERQVDQLAQMLAESAGWTIEHYENPLGSAPERAAPQTNNEPRGPRTRGRRRSEPTPNDRVMSFSGDYRPSRPAPPSEAMRDVSAQMTATTVPDEFMEEGRRVVAEAEPGQEREDAAIAEATRILGGQASRREVIALAEALGGLRQ